MTALSTEANSVFAYREAAVEYRLPSTVCMECRMTEELLMPAAAEGCRLRNDSQWWLLQVLRAGGHYVLVSCRDPDVRLPLALRHGFRVQVGRLTAVVCLWPVLCGVACCLMCLLDMAC